MTFIFGLRVIVIAQITQKKTGYPDPQYRSFCDFQLHGLFVLGVPSSYDWSIIYYIIKAVGAQWSILRKNRTKLASPRIADISMVMNMCWHRLSYAIYVRFLKCVMRMRSTENRRKNAQIENLTVAFT